MGGGRRGMGASFGLLGLLTVCLVVAASPVGSHATASAQPPTLLAIESSPSGRGGNGAGNDQLRVLDPLTLGDRPEYPPIALGKQQVGAVAPGGRLLAALVYPDLPMPPPAVPPVATLHLIDLVAWRETPTNLRVRGTIEWMGFAPDGRALYWLAHEVVPGFGPRPTSYRLMRYDLQRKQERAVLTLPGPLLGDPAITVEVGARDGGWLALYYVPADADNQAAGAPQLLRFDFGPDRVRYDVALDGVRQGTFVDERGSESFALPGLGWDLDGERLHVVHADADRLTSVGLGDGAILGRWEIAGVAPPRAGDVSPWEATGHVGDTGRLLRASVGAGGSRLFVTGGTFESEALPGGGARERRIAHGVRVIDLARHAEVARLDSNTFLAVSPDGMRLVGYTLRYEQGRPVDEPGVFRLRVYDTGGLRELQRLDVSPGDLWPQFFSPDGRAIYMLRPQGGTLARESTVPWGTIGGPPVLARFDLETGTIVAERAVGGFGGVLPTWRLP